MASSNLAEAPAQHSPSRWQRAAARASKDLLHYAAFVRGFTPAIDEHWALVERLLYGSDKELVLGATGIAKSQWVTLWLEWLLGRNPNLRVLVVSEIQSGIATDVVTEIRETIETNERYLMTFGDLKGESTRWGTHGLQFRPLTSSTPPPPFAWLPPRGRRPGLRGDNCKPAGWRTGFTGARIDLLVGDDLVSDKSAYSAAVTEAAWRTLHQKALTRAAGPGFRAVLLGQTWAPRDLYGRLREQGVVCYDTNPNREGLDALGAADEVAA